MTEMVVDEGQYVADLIYGRGKRARFDAPEPSLLPHLAAYLCHDFTIPEVLESVRQFGTQGSLSPPWFPLFESVLWAVAGRDDLAGMPIGAGGVSEDHWRVVSALRSDDQQAAQALFHQQFTFGFDYPSQAGAARLAPLLTEDQVRALHKDPAFFPDALDAESVRSLLVAFEKYRLPLSTDWILAAETTQWSGEFDLSRQAHLLPFLPSDVRRARADALAVEVGRFNMPPDMRALWVSRIAPFVSSGDVWDRAVLLDNLKEDWNDQDGVWRDHIEWLLGAGWTTEPWGDVFRAHPEFRSFQQVSRPHETTADAPRDIGHRWMGMEAAAAPSGGEPPMGPGDAFEAGEAEEDAAADAPTRSRVSMDTAFPEVSIEGGEPQAATLPPTGSERRLQADVLLEDSMLTVSAFAAGRAHLIDVSIGFGASIRADRGFDETIFDTVSGDWLVLPVWFHAGDQKQSGTIRLPRDQTRSSTTFTFTFNAPAAPGRVLARIHVMRPGGGLLLQSALFVGDVVTSIEAAHTHTPGFEITIDVIAGDLQDPASATQGKAIIADQRSALAEVDDQLVEIDVSMLQNHLVKLVHEIETAADRLDLDESAVSKVLVDLAIAGQGLRAQFEGPLKHFMDVSPLQIVSLRSGDVLPLELIYDGPALSLSSRLCPTWKQALREGKCACCAGGGPESDSSPARVCPMRFWSMRKVIERRTADAQEGPFRVSGERSAQRTHLRAIHAVVIGASGRVTKPDVERVRALAAAKFSAPAETAENWQEWLQEIEKNHPELLVAMPHNQAVQGGLSSALMVGEPDDDTTPPPDETMLLAGGVGREYVQTTGDRPGPIVLLLGCNTQFEDRRLSGFAGEFREQGAAITVGTLGELRADQAPRAAQALIGSIAEPTAQGASMGKVLLDTRRQLLSDGMIMALLLVANGDAEWLLPEP